MLRSLAYIIPGLSAGRLKSPCGISPSGLSFVESAAPFQLENVRDVNVLLDPKVPMTCLTISVFNAPKVLWSTFSAIFIDGKASSCVRPTLLRPT